MASIQGNTVRKDPIHQAPPPGQAPKKSNSAPTTKPRGNSSVKSRQTKDPTAYRRSDATRAQTRRRWGNKQDAAQRQSALNREIETGGAAKGAIKPKAVVQSDRSVRARRIVEMEPLTAKSANAEPAATVQRNLDPRASSVIEQGAPANTGNQRLDAYFANKPADTSKVPETLAAFEYGSKAPSETDFNYKSDKEYIAGYVPTPPIAGKLADGSIGNAFNPEWQQQIGEAAERNGGLGNSEDGFLAWSGEGFVRFRNPGLTPEQNRRMAEISLTTGFKVEQMPSRWTIPSDDAQQQDKLQSKVQGFINNYDKELADFRADPKDRIELKDGRRRFRLKLDDKSGRAVSYSYKKKGGFGGFVQKNLKYIQPVISVAGAVLAPFTAGASLAVSAVANAAATVAATGKLAFETVVGAVGGALAPITGGISTLVASGINAAKNGAIKAKDLLSTAASYIIGNGDLGSSASAALRTGANVAGTAIDTGKFSAVDLVDGLAGSLGSITGNPTADAFVDSALRTGAGAIDRGEILASDIAGAIAPLVQGLGVPPTAQGLISGGLDAVANAIDRGEVRAADFATAVNGAFADTPKDRRIKRAVTMVARSIDTGRIDPKQVAKLLVPLITSNEG